MGAEVLELTEVFVKHDALQKGEMREFELARALNWLGYPLSHQRRQMLWCNVDVNKSDTVDSKEFLKLIRLLREEETSAAVALIEKAQKSATGGTIREEHMRDMLNRLGYAPPQ